MAEALSVGSTSESNSSVEPMFYDAEGLKENLLDALDDISVDHAFAHGRSNADFTDPGLHVHGHGFIRLPLSQEDAKGIIAKCRKSPFGKGSHTIVDDSVRRCWELNPDQFTLHDPGWRAQIDGLIPEIHKELALGCGTQNVRAELYKLLLYEEGAFFKSHQDTEKIPGMFGTLMIALPSPHRGGELVLQHQYGTWSHGTDTGSESKYSYAAWYSDVFHEVRPVLQGYRLVLTYNLAMSAPSSTIATTSTTHTNHQSRMQALLQQWDTELIGSDRPSCSSRFPAYLAYPLEHQYTQANLRVDRLLAHDRMRTECLQRAAEAVGASVFLGILEMEIVKDDDEEDDGRWFEEEEEEDDEDDEDGDKERSEYGGWHNRAAFEERDHEELSREKSIKSIVALDGTKMMDDLDYFEENLLGDTPWDEDNPDDEEHSGYPGNEGCTATYWYRDAAVIVVPQTKVHELMFRGNRKWRNAQKWLGDLKAELQVNQHAKYKLERLCKLLLKAPDPRPSIYYIPVSSNIPEDNAKRACIREITQIGLETGMPGLFDAAWVQLEGGLHLECFYQLGCCVAQNNPARIRSSILSTIGKRKGIAARYEAYELVVSGFKSTSTTLSNQEREAFQDWLDKELIDFVVSDTKNLCKPDGAALSKIWAKADAGSRTSLETSLFAAPTTIQIGFCLRLATEDDQQHISDAERDAMLRVCLSQIWGGFAFDSTEIIATLNSPDAWQIAEAITTATNLVELIRLTDLHNVLPIEQRKEGHESEDLVASRLLLACTFAQADDLKHTLMPFVRPVLCNAVPRLVGDNTDRPSYGEKIATTVLKRYASVCVGAKPTPPSSYAVAYQGSCTCQDCNRVNTFLRSPTETVGRFPMGKSRRDHLHHMFPDSQTADYSVITLGGSNPNVWEMTKARHSAYIAEDKAWKVRARELWAILAALDSTRSLGAFVGTGLYQAVKKKDLGMLLAVQELEDQRTPLSEATGNATKKRPREEDASGYDGRGPSKRAAQGSARPVRIVDLTDD